MIKQIAVLLCTLVVTSSVGANFPKIQEFIEVVNGVNKKTDQVEGSVTSNDTPEQHAKQVVEKMNLFSLAFSVGESWHRSEAVIHYRDTHTRIIFESLVTISRLSSTAVEGTIVPLHLYCERWTNDDTTPNMLYSTEPIPISDPNWWRLRGLRAWVRQPVLFRINRLDGTTTYNDEKLLSTLDVYEPLRSYMLIATRLAVRPVLYGCERVQFDAGKDKQQFSQRAAGNRFEGQSFPIAWHVKEMIKAKEPGRNADGTHTKGSPAKIVAKVTRSYLEEDKPNEADPNEYLAEVTWQLRKKPVMFLTERIPLKSTNYSLFPKEGSVDLQMEIRAFGEQVVLNSWTLLWPKWVMVAESKDSTEETAFDTVDPTHTSVEDEPESA